MQEMPKVDIEVREKNKKRRQTEFEKMIAERCYEAIGSALARQRKKYIIYAMLCLIIGMIIGVILGLRF